MKKYIILISFFILTISACKKELEINVEKTFIETGIATSGSLGFGGIILTLMPDGKADLLNSGDIVYRGTYKINDNNVTVKVNNEQFKFEVISNNELRYDKNRIQILEN